MSRHRSGWSARSARISANPVFVPVAPSTTYVPSVNGRPTKPSSVAPVPSSSARSFLRTSPTKGTLVAGSKGGASVIALNASRVRIGEILIAPPSEMAKSTPIAGSGVRMSENRMTPSTP